MPPTITFYGGVNEIGGNKFLVETDRTRVFLDFGMSFKAYGDYFNEFLNPRALNGLGDWWRLNLLPRRISGLYRTDYLTHQGLPQEERGIDGVVVTHAHMDHIGEIHFVRDDIPILASRSSFAIMKALEEVGPGDEYLNVTPAFRVGPGKSGRLKRLTADDVAAVPRPKVEYGATDASVGNVKVRGVAEDHSLPGASGILIEAGTARIAYTGDFRFHGRHREKSWSFIDSAAEFQPDYLLVEGTRVHKEGGASEEDVAREIHNTMMGTPALVLANWPARDTDRFLSFYEAAKRAGRKLCINIKQAYMLRELRAAGETDLPSLDDRHLGIYVPRRKWGAWRTRADVPHEIALQDYDVWEREFVQHPNAVMAQDLREAPQDYAVRLDFFELKELVDLDPPPGSRYIRSVVEPFDEQMKLDGVISDNWLKLFGLYPYVEKHASGHASGPELWEAIAKVKPKVVVPIHVSEENVHRFRTALGPMGIEVREPANALIGGKPLALDARP